MLEFLGNLACRQYVPSVSIIDQPLYWKSTEIISAAPESSQLKNIVLMLGCFNIFMKILGEIGKLMEGTGLEST